MTSGSIRARNRDGFTLVELVVSMTLLAVVGLLIGSVTARLASSSARSGQTLSALDLADERLRLIQSDPSYGTLETRYAGVESALTGFPGLVRTTALTRVTRTMPNNRLLDYKMAVVTVSGPGISSPVVRSISVGAP